MLDNLIKTYDTCIEYYTKQGDKKKVSAIKKKKKAVKKKSLFTQDES